ncbi:MAG: nitroreductase/quinone reductase family protein [Kineosporiaceae bacterium]
MGRDWDARLRRMYPDGRAGAAARRFARFWAAVFRLGLQPRRWVTLEVPGRSSGLPRRFPLGMADLDGRWYLVSMLGECHWVANVRAAGGEAALLRGRRRPVRLVEVPPAERARVVSCYLEQVPGGRPHIRARLAEPGATLESVATALPVFRVEPR